MTRRARVLTTALVAVLAVVASACTGIFGGEDPRFLEVQFETAHNLFEGSDVRVAGVDVGHISQIDVPEGANVVTARLQLHHDLELPEDVRAVIVPQALLGERYIQLDPPYTGGPTYDLSATLPIERTSTPTDFDEVLDSLNDYLQALPKEEVARLVSNLAEVLDGNGEEIGRTLESAEVLIDVLQENDDELVNLARRVSDLNESLATRDEQIGAFIEDFNTVAASLADDREEIDAAVDGLVRMTEELARLLGEQRGGLEDDIATLTRLGRTAVRNLDEIDRFFYWSAELYRHAERVIDREHNWLPLVQHFQGLSEMIADRVSDRVVGLCLRLELPDCETLGEELPERICLDPILPCENAADPEQTVPAADALGQLLEDHPELRERLEEEGRDIQDAVGDLAPDADADDDPSEQPSEEPDEDDDEGLDDLLPPLRFRGVVR